MEFLNNTKRVRTLLKVLTLFFCCGWYFYNSFKSDLPADCGDGIMHFFLSNASWENPSLFLDHWGKPLFILLSSPFSQFGFNGLICFNILVFLLTIYISWKIANQLVINFYLQLLFPLLLINIQDYSLTVLGGLTEPLFNLFLIISFWFLINEKWNYLAIIVSFMPFLRSEGQLSIFLVFILLFYFKKYKFIPYLFSGMLIYSIIGYFVFGDFLWYFTHNPYHLNNSIYNHGSWNHYLLSYKNYLGNPGVFVFLISILCFIYFMIKRTINLNEYVCSFYVYGTYLTILFLHSYFWATGQNGSMGLTRIATQGLPCFLLLNFYFINRLTFLHSNKGTFFTSILILAFIIANITSKHFPVQPNTFEKSILKASSYLESNISSSIFYHHPLICFKLKNNPFKDSQRCKLFYSKDLQSELDNLFIPGDYLVWDSQFGPREEGLSLETITKEKHLRLIREFGDFTSGKVIIYQYK